MWALSLSPDDHEQNAAEEENKISQTPNLIVTVESLNRPESINSFVPKSLMTINFYNTQNVDGPPIIS